MASGGLGGVDPTGAGAIGTGMDDVQSSLMVIAMQEAERKRMREMMLELQMGGGGGGLTPASTAAFGMGSSGDQFFR